jgi:LMBR1 domain-containing protein 1
MVDAFLIVTAIIFALLLLGGSFMLLVYFSHPDDRNEAYFPKVVVITALWLGAAAILVLPYDIANSRGDGGGLRVDILWQVVLIAIAFYITILIPFAFFYYESNKDPEEELSCWQTQLCDGLKYTIGFLFTFLVILFIMFAFLNEAELPVNRIAQNSQLLVPLGSSFPSYQTGCGNNCLESDFILKIPVTFPIYVIAFLAFIGWWFLVMFAGVGIVGLPISLINEYRTRPEPMSDREYIDNKRVIGRRARELGQIGKKLHREMTDPDANSTRSKRKEQAKTLARFEEAYYFVKKDYEILQISYRQKGGNPVWYAFKLVLGVLGAVVSFTWLLHISLFMLPVEPAHPFLNNFFIDLEEVGGGGFPLFGIVAFAIYAYWLMWCVVRGNIQIGIRFLFWRMYPMEIDNTLMNAFLANTWVIVVCIVPIVQFCVRAFPVYARFTSADLLIGTQAQHLKFFRYFWENNVFIYIMLAFSFFTLISMCVWPKDRGAEIESELERLRKQKPGDSDSD